MTNEPKIFTPKQLPLKLDYQEQLLPAKAKTSPSPKNTRAQLSSLIKSARDIMRKDAGLSGDLDRLPQLSWILFLKYLRRPGAAPRGGCRLEPASSTSRSSRRRIAGGIGRRMRIEGATGEELLKFVNDDLLPALRELAGTDEKLKVAEVFKETYNRMLSGYLLRDVVNLVDGIHFQSQDEIFTLSHLYEFMLKEMRDAAGDSGEFYTPTAGRPVDRGPGRSPNWASASSTRPAARAGSWWRPTSTQAAA